MAYKIRRQDGDASIFNYLACAPRLLHSLATFAKKQHALEDLEAFLLLQYIDSRARQGKPVIKEFALLSTEFIRSGSPWEVNITGDLRKRVSWAAIAGSDDGLRDELLVALCVNMSDILDRYAVGHKLQLPKLVARRSEVTEAELLEAYKMVRGIAGKTAVGPREISDASGTGFMRAFNRYVGRF